MIEFRKGDIFESGADVLVCPVNCVGVMGKGLAKAFKERFKGLEASYKEDCKNADIWILEAHETFNHKENVLLKDSCFKSQNSSHEIMLLPTKKHWKNPSKLEWIECGIITIRCLLETRKMMSIAIPALGCGCGELNWADVKPLFEKYLSDLPNEIYVYEPICNTVS